MQTHCVVRRELWCGFSGYQNMRLIERDAVGMLCFTPEKRNVLVALDLSVSLILC
jgi:hypothetical protein